MLGCIKEVSLETKPESCYFISKGRRVDLIYLMFTEVFSVVLSLVGEILEKNKISIWMVNWTLF